MVAFRFDTVGIGVVPVGTYVAAAWDLSAFCDRLSVRLFSSACLPLRVRRWRVLGRCVVHARVGGLDFDRSCTAWHFGGVVDRVRILLIGVDPLVVYICCEFRAIYYALLMGSSEVARDTALWFPRRLHVTWYGHRRFASSIISCWFSAVCFPNWEDGL